MYYLYILISVASVLVYDRAFGLFTKAYGWWLTPVMLIAVFLLMIILHIIVVLVSALFINMKKPMKSRSAYWRFLVKATISLAFRLARVHIHTTGADTVPKDGRFLLVCNHTHEIDPAIIINQIPECDIGFIGKKEIIQQLPLIARVMHKLNCLFIDRENNRSAARTIVEAVRLIKDDIVSVGIFPEGYTSLDGELHGFRNGAFKIAYKANVPIVVCTVEGVPKILKNMFIRRTDVYLDFIAVIPTERFAEVNTTQLGDEIFALMQENIDRRKQQ